ncbi:MAG TPA: neutral/alkaline non-lysosomal ceramidase N-terminal domain-containing protein [Bryobacteraceae bacterium]|nr:neutral/alkaline non-lysosomal ceramidase N-terminal domain-containing protein [Bryobacteraceae bacterium]
MPQLLAGTGRADITPAPGTPQGGWGAQTHQRGLGSDLPLYATALVLRDDSQTVAIVDVDSIGFDPEWTQRILDAIAALTGLPLSHIRFSCTHTHSGPNTFRIPVITEGRDMILEYLGGLPHQIAGAVWQAMQDLQPARIGAAQGECDINMNRRQTLPDGRVIVGRNPGGVVDRTVRVVRIDSLDEQPIATLLHYACHPTTAGWDAKVNTPDYPGMAKQIVEQQLGGKCLFLQGATGNLGPRQGFTGDLNIYRRLGHILGLEAAKLALNIDTLPREAKLVGLQASGTTIALFEDVPVEPPVPALAVNSQFLQLPVKPFPPPEEAEAEAAAARAELAQLRQSGTEEQVRAATSKATQAGMKADRARLYHGRTHMPWQLQAIRIGDVALVCIPGEPFIEISQEIAARSPFPHTLFSGYSNGGFSYLPVRSAYPEGGYEVETSPFSEDAAELVVEEALRVLQDLQLQ